MSINLSDGVAKVVDVVNNSTTLWKKDQANPSCPEKVEFAFTLPHHYETPTATHPLPPTFQVIDQEGLYMHVRVAYRMKFSVTKAPKGRFSRESTKQWVFRHYDAFGVWEGLWLTEIRVFAVSSSRLTICRGHGRRIASSFWTAVWRTSRSCLMSGTKQQVRWILTTNLSSSRLQQM